MSTPNEGKPVSASANDDDVALPPDSVLTKEFFRANTVGVDDAQFEDRWKASLEDPLLYFRSYVRPFYAYLKNVKPPGRIGVCYGDAHPNNFGFVLFGKQLSYVYNDLDDSGPCPAAFDALRYFTALRLLEKDDDLVLFLKISCAQNALFSHARLTQTKIFSWIFEPKLV